MRKTIADFFGGTIFKNSVINSAGTFLSGFIGGYLFHFLVSRQLSVGEYGELQSLFSVFAISGTFVSVVTIFVVKHSAIFARTKDYLASLQFTEFVERKAEKVAIIFFILFLFISPVIYFYLHLSSFWGLVVVDMAVALAIVSTIYSSTLSGWEDFFAVNLAGAAGALIKLLAGFLLAVLFAKASFVIAAYFVNTICVLFLTKFLMRRKLAPALVEKNNQSKVSGENNWQKYFPSFDFKKEIFPTLAFSLALVFIQNIDVMFVKNLTSAEMTGYYGALKTLGLVIFTVNAAIIAVVFPTACADGHESGCMNSKTILHSYSLISFCSLGTIGFYFLFPEFTVNLLFGAKYVSVAGSLWLFGLAAAALSFLALEANFAFARRDSRASYIIFADAILMAILVYAFHGTLTAIISSVLFAFVIGYAAVLALNFFGTKRTEINRCGKVEN